MKNRRFKASLLLASMLASISALAETHSQEALIKQGEYLARLGDCMACHTAPGKPAFAGGLAIESPAGTIWSTNITPDKQHGIGSYSEQQFADALRKGIRQDGSYLYPAMPYADYAKISDEDINALYAWFMHGVAASDYQPPATALRFPLSQRWGMRFWNWIYGNDKPFTPPQGASAQVARGAYIVEGLGHCGSCHTPRGLAMNEKAYQSAEPQFLAGGELNHWPVPGLRGIPRWTQQEIVDYLQTGRNAKAGVAGEMTAVVAHSTSHMSDSDLQAIAAYLQVLGGNPHPVTADAAAVEATAARLRAGVNLNDGERLYLDNCNACHFVNGQGAPHAFPQLDQASVVTAEQPGGLIKLILYGAELPSTAKSASTLRMPGFAERLSDKQVAQLATFIRQGWSNRATAVTEKQVAEIRKEK